MTRKETAMRNFTDGYNCTQAVVLAFADLLPIDRETLLRLSSSFGGGMGRLREVCGTVSAMFLVIGILYGYDTPETGAVKAAHYTRVQTLAARFEARYSSIVCRDLLGLSVKHDQPTPEARTAAYYQKRPCREIVGTAAELLEAFIAEENARLEK